MTKLEKLISYMELCDIKSNRELVEKGGYPKSVQFLGMVLNGQKNFSADEEMLIYSCINQARAVRLMTNDKS